MPGGLRARTNCYHFRSELLVALLASARGMQMALFEYWMVYLPEFNPDSYLLFDHNPDRGTTLRDYSWGTERKLGHPSVRSVRGATEWNRTRFEEKPHPVNGPDGTRYWTLRTAEYNTRYLASAQALIRSQNAVGPPAAPAITMSNPGRARRGSQRQLQDYVNLQQPALDAAIFSVLPHSIQQNSPQINWLSPLASDQFREYRDTEFLAVLGLHRYSSDLKRFWPERGPCWDGLAVLATTLPRSLPVALLVEAKSHIREVYGDGCQAGEASRALIQKSMAAAKKWCGAGHDADWMGPLYQSANRIAHLYFFHECLKCPCLLVNLYFVDDPYRPTSRAEWISALPLIRTELGLTQPVRGVFQVLLPALTSQDELMSSEEVVPAAGFMENAAEPAHEFGNPPSISSLPAQRLYASFPARSRDEELSFVAWCSQWNVLGAFQGPALLDPQARIRRAIELWQQPIPGRWQRDVDHQLLACRYRRGDLNAPHPGEHTIEHQILVERFGQLCALGGTLVDGVNAFPLACDFASGGRRGNVEADMLLAVRSGETFRLFLCEVKAGANDPWYAAVECLRQMRLFLANPVGRAIMQQRGFIPRTPSETPVTGLVVAPSEYYRCPGKRANAVQPASELFHSMHNHFGIDLRLAVWDAALSTIREL